MQDVLLTNVAKDEKVCSRESVQELLDNFRQEQTALLKHRLVARTANDSKLKQILEEKKRKREMVQ